jgi:dTDP-4-amino-4,6-dideoxygalactose transaminase
VDIDSETFNMDLNLVESVITPRTKAIIPVHLFGEMVNMDKLLAIAKTYNLAIIEDCAQSFGSACHLGKA